MSQATVTSKGQVTIPVEVRRAMGLGAQDLVTFTVMPGGTAVLRAKTKSLLDVRGMLKPASRRKKVAIEDMGFGGS